MSPYFQEDNDQKLSTLRRINEDNLSRLRLSVADLQAEFCAACRHGEVKDVAVSTEDGAVSKCFRAVGVQTDRETFVRPPVDEDSTGKQQQQRAIPKKLDLTSVGFTLAGRRDDALSPSSSPDLRPVLSEQPAPSHAAITQENTLRPPPPSLSTSESHAQRVSSPQTPPPPPPPPPPGVAPPPPPPHSHSFTIEKPPRKPAVEPSRPMRPLYWDRIQIQDKK